MSDIFVEVDEALKQEKLENLWKKYGGLVIGAIIALILGTATNAGYQSWKTSHDTKQTNIFLSAEKAGNATTEELVSAADQIDGGLKTLTMIRAASTALENGDKDKAASLFAQISQNDQAEPNFRALATYMTVHTSSEMNDEQKIASLSAIAKDQKNPWNLYAKLDLALLLGGQKNDFAQAHTYLKEISDEEKAPKTLRQKAQSIDILYALKDTQE
jgi:hypothetical protein